MSETTAFNPQQAMTERYRAARQAWASNAAIQQAASYVGLNTERAYCDAYVSRNYQPLTWTATTTSGPRLIDIERAFREAAL